MSIGKAWRHVWLALAVIVVACIVAAGSARAADPVPGVNAGSDGAKGFVFKICRNQTYALCATASCFVFNDVSYCTCDVKKGDSISLPFHFGYGQDVCTVNAAGVGNGYMVSTYSFPPAVRKPQGDKALYTCKASTSTGAYAQCDGGFCFRSTQGKTFPGSSKAIKAGQIICSCPITVANPTTAKLGYQIVGPYPCQRSFFKNCTSAGANTDTGAKIYVGAPTGSARLLTRLLDGTVPPLNTCVM